MTYAVTTPRALFAVIEDARRHQQRRRRRRRLILATVAVGGLIALLLGPLHLGASVHGGTTTSTAVTLYFQTGASRAAIDAAAAFAHHERGVAGVTFVSKQAALQTMKRRYPTLVGHLVANPLPDSLVVRLQSDRTRIRTIVASLGRLRAVAHVQYVTAKRSS